MTGGARPTEVVVGLDVGTSAVKAAAFAPGSAWRALASRELRAAPAPPGHHVQAPAAVLTAATDALAECVAAAAPARVVAVALSAGMHGLVALDDACRPLTDVVTWADGRATEPALALHRAGQAGALLEATGTPVHPMSPVVKLRWFREHRPDVWAAARWWVGLKELVIRELTGELVVDASSASGSGLRAVAGDGWSELALDAAGVDVDRLAPVVPTTTILPLTAEAAARTGLTAGTPVVVGAADGPLANVGCGAVGPGVAGLSVGTSAAVRMLVDRPGVDPDHALFCYGLTPGTWVLGGALANGAEVARWAAARFEPGRGPDRALVRAAAVVPGCDGLVHLPFLLPERAPRWDPDLAGAYLGVRPHHTGDHFLRASIEGVALQFRALVDALDRAAPVAAIRATGGAFASPLWRQVVAAAVARPLTVTTDADGTARGAAALAWLALDRAADLGDAAHQLGAGPSDDDTPERVDPAVARALDATRDRIPVLLESLSRATTPPD